MQAPEFKCPNCAELMAKIKALEAAVRELRSRLEKYEGKTSSGGSASPPPFVKENVKRRSKKPGQKPGHEAYFRAVPRQIDERIKVPLPACPYCGGCLEKRERHVHMVEEVVPAHTVVLEITTESAFCPTCNQEVESKHSELISSAGGQATVSLGPRALATAVQLKHELRLSYAQTAQTMKDHFGLHITPGGLAQVVQRVARRLQGACEVVRQGLRSSKAVYADETGWRTAGRNTWLWAFTNDRFAVYEVDASRAHGVPLRVLGPEFKGTVICDFFAAYNVLPYEKQRCLVHLLRDLNGCAEKKDGRARGFWAFYKKVRRLVHDALRLKERAGKRGWPKARVVLRAERLMRRLEKISLRNYWDDDAGRLGARMWKHGEELLVFLTQPGVEGTNNRAERAIRPQVIARKVSGGNRSSRGSKALSVLATLIQTSKLQGRHVVDTLTQLLKDAFHDRPLDWVIKPAPS